MNRLCFGGSFNPIHNGHLACAQTVAQGKYDQVVLIPTRQPPHKSPDYDLAEPTHRLAMCRLAIEDRPLFHVSSIEMTLPGPSYSIQTARALKGSGYDHVDWLIGADQLTSLPTWHQADKLMNEVRFVVMARPGYRLDWSALPERYQSLRESVVVAPRIDISATDIRRRVAQGLPIAGLVPPQVEQYIHDHQLYRRRRRGSAPPPTPSTPPDASA